MRRPGTQEDSLLENATSSIDEDPPRRGAARIAELIPHHRIDLLLLVAITAFAAVWRLWDLGDVPQGIHGDEAQFAVDAQRVISDVWIGPYVTSALGQPSGIAYVIAPGQWLFGHTPLGARFSIALYAIAAVPLAYVFFRLHSSRFLAATGAFLLAASLWHIHFSRVAHLPAMTPTIVLAVLVCWWLAMNRGHWYWFALAGGLLGLGLYSYTVYPIFVVAFGVWVAFYTMVHRRDELFMPWAKKVALAAGVSVVVGLPLFFYILNPANDYFSHYRGYYEQYSVLQSDAYQEGDLGDKVDLIADQVERYVGAYAWSGVTDLVDASSPDRRPMFDRVTLLLLVGGVIIAARRWREPANQLALVMLLILPLAGLLQTNATYRGSIAVVPFVAYLSALPLAALWQHTPHLGLRAKPVAYAAIGVALALVAYTNVHAYFGPWAGSDTFRWVYAQEISEASEYIDSLPEEPYVYFYSGRWSFNYETRQYLAPNARGEDRSLEFGRRQDFEVDRTRDSVIVLLPPYLEAAGAVQALYPEAELHTGSEGERVLFLAMEVPALR